MAFYRPAKSLRRLWSSSKARFSVIGLVPAKFRRVSVGWQDRRGILGPQAEGVPRAGTRSPSRDFTTRPTHNQGQLAHGGNNFRTGESAYSLYLTRNLFLELKKDRYQPHGLGAPALRLTTSNALQVHNIGSSRLSKILGYALLRSAVRNWLVVADIFPLPKSRACVADTRANTSMRRAMIPVQPV